MEMHHIIYCLTICATLLTSCGQKSTYNEQNIEADSALNVTYAKGFKVDYFDGYKRVTIANPWAEGKMLATYYLIKDSSTQTPSNGTRIIIPIKHLVALSCTHYEFLSLLGELPSVTGICDPELAYNQQIRQGIANGSIQSLGSSFNLNLEKLLALKPDALMLSSYGQQDENSKRLQNAGIPLIYNNEWTESSILGRTEWIKLVAAFYDKEVITSAYFDTIAKSYLESKALVANNAHKPSVMLGGNFKGTWYMPGGQGYMAQLLADAGADYFYKDNTSTESLPLSFETVLMNFSEADIWLNAPTETMQELIAMDERHKLFKAAENGQVYGFYARKLPSGANDFWESGVAHPDLILKDLISVLYPELMPNYAPTYINKLR